MKSYIIGIVCILLLVSLLYFNDRKEHFSNKNIIKNGDFQDGTDIKNLVSRENNFNIIAFSNPENLQNVLKQSAFNNNGYKIKLDIPKNTKYVLKYWLGTSDLYDGTNDTVKITGNGDINYNSKITSTEMIDNINWKQIEVSFNSSNNNVVVLDIGKLGSFSKGHRLYSDFILNANLENISDFYFLDRLVAFFMSNKTIDSNIFRSEINNHTVKFKNPISLSDDLVSLRSNSGEMSNADKLFINDEFNNEFSIMFSYKGEENEQGSLLRMDAVNDLAGSGGIEIQIKNTTGINNKVSVTVGEVRYIYTVGLTNRLVNYFVTYNQNGIRLFVDGIPITSQPEMYKLDNKWKKCTNNKKCINNVKLHFANIPAKINNDSGLNGGLKTLLIYNKELSDKDIVSINKYFVVKNSMLSIESICNRPTMIRDSISSESTPNISSDCPFNDNRICRNADCSCVNWTTLADVPEGCKKIVNSYCKDNYDDKKCIDLRATKCKTQKIEKKQEKIDKNKLDRDMTVKKLKKEIELLKNKEINRQETNEKDCKDCDSKIDLSKYIKKTEIPCWGCKL